MSLEITTNKLWQQFHYIDEVPKDVVSDYLDLYETDEGFEDGWIKYKKDWYHLNDFLRLSKGSPLHSQGWEGYHAESYFSGKVLKISENGEGYQIGAYYS